jgi:light-regulated signal transduction histidine kinase (bacteriophytochrome)
MQAIELGEVKQYSMALHEIRKLNREVKQTAERICRLMSPDDPDNADPELVKIMKTSELMSHQFDVIEILANETLATLPLNSTSEIYKIFDKCARIYRSERRRIMLEAPPNYHARVKVCDKTFPIIPSVLIENALKYSADLEVRISIQPGGQDKVIVAVSNLARLKAPLTEAVFMRGYRASQDSEGSGNGLYVAQLVARQHSTMLRVETLPAHANLTRVTLRAIFHALEH